MSLLGSISAVQPVRLSGQSVARSQAAQTTASQQASTPRAAKERQETPQTEGFGQLGRVIAAALGATEAATEAETAAETGAETAAETGAGNDASAATAADTQSVLAALLAQVSPEAEDSKVLDLSAAADTEAAVSETEARSLVEMSGDASLPEDIANRTTPSRSNPADAAAEGRTDPMETVSSQMTRLGATQGAYSVVSLAAIALEAQPGRSLRLTL
jgi:hypothetical protein